MKRIALIVAVTIATVTSTAAAEPRPIHRSIPRGVSEIPVGGLQRAGRGQQVRVIPPDRYRHPTPAVDRWYREALQAGWPEKDWPRLACIIHRESRGDRFAHNPRYPDDSYGLIQLNMRAHRKWVGPAVGWDFTRLFDGYTNLATGRTLFDMAVGYYGDGWRPWISNSGSCSR